VYVVVVQKFTFAISSPDEFLLNLPFVNPPSVTCVSYVNSPRASSYMYQLSLDADTCIYSVV